MEETQYLLKQRLKEILDTLKIFFKFLITDIQRKPRTFTIGLTSIFLVVGFLVLLSSLLDITPIIFMKLAEDQNGQFDLTFTPTSDGDNTTINALNLTDFQNKLQNSSVAQTIVPRWIVPVNVSEYRAYGIVLDSSKEKTQGVGDRLDVPNLGPLECWISKSLAELTNLDGQSNFLFLNMNITNL